MTWMTLALLAPLMYAASNVIDKYALEQHTSGLADYMAFASLGSIALAIALGLFGSTGHAAWPEVWPALHSGGLMNASYLLFAICLTKTVTLALGVQPVYVILIVFVLGKLNPTLINEHLSSRKLRRALLGTALIVSGLAILATME